MLKTQYLFMTSRNVRNNDKTTIDKNLQKSFDINSLKDIYKLCVLFTMVMGVF